MLNRCEFIGNLGGDPETRFLPSGGSVSNFSVAVSEKWKNKETGQPEERTEWVRCAVFGKLSDVVAEYLRKGSKVYVAGTMRTRKWQDQSGQDKYTTEIVIKDLEMLGEKPQPSQDDAVPEMRPSDDIDMDIPF